MRLTRRPTTTRKATVVALASVAGAAALSLVVTSALAAPKPAPAAPTPTTTAADTTPPPAPGFAQKPDNPTTNQNAHFRMTSTEAGVTFRCSLDGGAHGTCGQVANYNNLDFGEHCLEVRTADGAGNLSPAATWCWSVVIQGGFPISGTVDQPFFPGVTRPLGLVIGNPYNFTIRVTEVAITVDDTTTPPGCSGATNLTVTQGLRVPVDVPRGSTMSLRQLGVGQADWPQLTMPNLPVNQDACKNVTFSLAFDALATKP